MVIETLTFRLMPGADEKAFIEADARLQTEFLYMQPGIVRRTTACNADGEWAIVTFWGSQADAEKSSVIDDPASDAFWALVDPSTVQRKIYESLD
jgi:hypothetical protein